MNENLFLPGVPVAHVCARLAAAGGDEMGSGKFAHPESSAALAVNAFGWFIERPMDLPSLPGTEAMGTPQRVEVEYPTAAVGITMLASALRSAVRG